MRPKEFHVGLIALVLCMCAESNVGAANATGWPTNWSAQPSVRRIANVPGISPDVEKLLAKVTNRQDVIGTRSVLTETGPHSKTWAVVPATGGTNGGGSARRVVAIGTGMNFWDPARAAWVPSTPAFVPVGDGFLAARVQHRTHLSANINVMGAVSVTHAGLTLRSTPVAIALTDAASGNSLVIATLSDTQGVQVDSNRVVFPNCFSAPGVCADISYTIELGAIHQDLVLRGRIDVAAWGFPEATTRINLISEFFGAPDPEKVIRPLRVESSSAVRQLMAIPDLIDEMLGFNESVFATGTAYVGRPGGTNISTIVAKQFTTSADGRKFLVESLECGSAPVRAAMLLLPPCGAVTPSAGAFRKASKLQRLFAALRPPPAATEANLKSGQTNLIAAAVHERPGFIVDYIQNIGGSLSGLSGTIVFKRDTTYFVASTVQCNSLAVFESAVFKYPNDISTSIVLHNGATCKCSTWNPAIFTGGDDDSIGDGLDTSIWSGYHDYSRGFYYANPAISVACPSVSLSNLHFRNAQEAIHIDGTSPGSGYTIAHCQFVNSLRGATCTGPVPPLSRANNELLLPDRNPGLLARVFEWAGGLALANIQSPPPPPSCPLTVNNCLMSYVQYPFSLDAIVNSTLHNCTVDNCATLAAASSSSGTFAFINCVLANVQSFSSGAVLGSSSTKNGFFHCGSSGNQTFGTSTFAPADGNSPFQTAGIGPGFAIGFGSYYLTDASQFRGKGRNLSSDLAAAPKGKTTYPPVPLLFMTISGELMLSPQVPRYSTGAPDLGYGYDPIDFAACGNVCAGGKITVLAGTAIGVLNIFSQFESAFQLWPGSSFVSKAGPTNPITFTGMNLVQESSAGYPGMATITAASFGGTPPILDFRFSNFFLPPGGDLHLWTGDSEWWGHNQAYWHPDSAVNWTMRDCSVRGGAINMGVPWGFPVPYVPSWGSGSVLWFNNLFDRVDMNIDPGGNGYSGVQPNLNLAFEARHNLFRGARFRLESFQNSDGSKWVFKDNLFDKVALEQDITPSSTALPLTHDYNAYWQLSGSELATYWEYNGAGPYSQESRLQVNDSSVDGVHDQFFSAAPPYVSGPYGDFYFSTTTSPTVWQPVLSSRASRSAADAGVFHFTERLDQTKEGSEDTAGTHPYANIGLHFVATTSSSSTQPKDSDAEGADGIPDFVENWHGDGRYDLHNGTETDWQHINSTLGADGVTHVADKFSLFYDDADLDGDGLNGVEERLLSTNPLGVDNPFSFSAIHFPSTASGTVQVPLSLSASVPDSAQILLTVNGVTDNTSVYKAGGQWFATWDTTQLPNGIYQLNFEIQLEEGDSEVALSSTVVTVQNPICLPYNWPIAGTAMHVEPQTIYAGGTWTMEVRNDQGTLFASLSGPVDGDGFCDYPDTSSTGITLSLLDQQGNQLPSTYYDVSVTAHSPTGSESATATTRVGVELPWTGNSFWAVAYLDAYLKDSPSDRALDIMFADMITQIWNSRYGGYSVINCPYREQPIPARLQYVADWGSLANSLYDQRVRNFIYFGHANKTGIGHNDINLSLTVANLQQLLKNGADPLTGWNKHPYHFVFLDGCDSGKGDLCKVFGIPKQKMSVAQMQARGLFPRAFLGWKGKTAKSVKNVLPGDHQRYVMTLFELWPQTNPVTGLPYKLWEAIDAAARQPPDPRGALWTSIQQDLVIWGCQDLEFWP